MRKINNPFITGAYVSAEYFCDREKESKELIRKLSNGNNMTIISPRRMGKTGLILHCFNNELISRDYYTFFNDIYSTTHLKEFVYLFGKVILILHPGHL